VKQYTNLTTAEARLHKAAGAIITAKGTSWTMDASDGDYGNLDGHFIAAYPDAEPNAEKWAVHESSKELEPVMAPAPKDAVAMRAKALKPDLSLMPLPAMHEICLALEEGALKHGGAFNFRDPDPGKEVRASLYVAAVLRHLLNWYQGREEGVPDSKVGVHHIGAAGACLSVMLDARASGKLVDDRPVPIPASDLETNVVERKRVSGLWR
jgi:hypothetical protein